MKIYADSELILELSNTDIVCLGNDLLSKREWIKAAIVGKVNNCKKRMIREWQPKLFDDPAIESIPATDESLISVIITRPDYKNRIDREVEAKKPAK